jgi:hypothetical protein
LLKKCQGQRYFSGANGELQAHDAMLAPQE